MQSKSDVIVTSSSEEEENESENSSVPPPPPKRPRTAPKTIESPKNDVGDKSPPHGDIGGGMSMLVTSVGDKSPHGADVAEGMSMLVTNVGDKPPSHGDGHESESVLETDVGEKFKIAQFQPVQSGTNMVPNSVVRFVFSKYREIIFIFRETTWNKSGCEVNPPKIYTEDEKEGDNGGASTEKSRAELG